MDSFSDRVNVIHLLVSLLDSLSVVWIRKSNPSRLLINELIIRLILHLKQVDEDTRYVAAANHDDNGDEDGGDALVSFTSAGLAPIGPLTGLDDDPVDVTVEDDEEEEGEEDHDEEVPNKNEVPAVAEVLS